MAGLLDPSNKDFEATFADLAFAQLRDKAPSLLDYIVGFQVVDKDEDGSHGIGVLGCKLGNQMLFIPSFFMNGELKQNLLYLQEQDLFVPLQDNWISYITSRHPYKLGKSEKTPNNMLGTQSPDLSPLYNPMQGGSSFGTRMASWDEWAKPASAMFGLDKQRYAKLPNLAEFLKKTANYGTSVSLARTITKSAAFGNAVLKFYKMADLLHKPEMPTTKLKPASNVKAPIDKRANLFSENYDAMFDRCGPHRVQIFYGTSNSNMLTDEDKNKLARGEILFKDAREKTNVAYRTSSTTRMANPERSGSYKLLLSDGSKRDVWIFPFPVATSDGFIRVALVIDKEKKTFNYWWPHDLYVDIVDDVETAHREDAANREGKSVSSLSVGDIAFVHTVTGNSTVAFKVNRRVKTETGIELQVIPIVNDAGLTPFGSNELINDEDISQFGVGNRRPYVGNVRINKPEESDVVAPDEQVTVSELHRIVIVDAPVRRGMKLIGKTLFIDNNAKAIDLTYDKYDTWQLPEPAKEFDVERNLLQKGAAEKLTLKKAGGDYYVNSTGPFSKIQVCVALVKKAGLSGEDAIALLKAVKEDTASTFLIKNAIGYAPPFPEPNMSYDSYSGAQMQEPMEMDIQMNRDQPDLSGYLGKPEMQQVMQAAETGQQEIFDTAAISALVKSKDNDELLGQYLSDIITGLDRVCRIMFRFYWFNEQFRERYGQENMLELDDHLNSVIKSLGDLVLFLKQRRVIGSPDFESIGIDLVPGDKR